MRAFPCAASVCVGRNYVEHQKEMGGDGREQPFFFAKSAHDLVPEGGKVHFPPMTSNYHWRPRWSRSSARAATRSRPQGQRSRLGLRGGPRHDRRESAAGRKDKGRPWTFGKDFDQSAPVGPITPASRAGHPKKASSGSR